jgi:hypothetical protein
MAKDQRFCYCARAPLLAQTGAGAGAGAVALLLVALVVVHSRFTYIKH